MATHTNVPSSVLQSKVVPFHSLQTITQTELVLFLSLRGRLQQLQEQVEAAEQDFKARLEAVPLFNQAIILHAWTHTVGRKK